MYIHLVFTNSYFLVFSNILKKSQIERLAESDDFEVVKEVQEYFGDFLAINSDLFTLNLGVSIYDDSLHTWNPLAFQRSLEGVISALLVCIICILVLVSIFRL